jgi:hypothetical protein
MAETMGCKGELLLYLEEQYRFAEGSEREHLSVCKIQHSVNDHANGEGAAIRELEAMARALAPTEVRHARNAPRCYRRHPPPPPSHAHTHTMHPLLPAGTRLGGPDGAAARRGGRDRCAQLRAP